MFNLWFLELWKLDFKIKGLSLKLIQKDIAILRVVGLLPFATFLCKSLGVVLLLFGFICTQLQRLAPKLQLYFQPTHISRIPKRTGKEAHAGVAVWFETRDVKVGTGGLLMDEYCFQCTA